MRSLLPQIGNEVVLQDGHRWASYYRSACSVPCATCGVAGIVGIVLRLPWKAHSVSFCLRMMALADACVAGLCLHGQARHPLPASSPALRLHLHLEVQLMAVLGAALLREAPVSPFVSSIS